MITVTAEFTNVAGVDVVKATYYDDCDSGYEWSGVLSEDSEPGAAICQALHLLATLQEESRVS